MCLAMFKPSWASVPEEHLREAFRENPDGAGVAVAMGDRVKIVKGLFTPGALCDVVRRYRKHDLAIHLRWATHGAVGKRNCHPFRIAPNLAVIHNGIIPGFGSRTQSDTAEFTDSVLKYYHSEGILEEKDTLDDLAEWIGAGSKLVIIRADGRAHIINESAGHWRDDIWYSNHSYLPSPWTTGSYQYPASWFTGTPTTAGRFSETDLCDWCGESRGAGNCVCYPRDEYEERRDRPLWQSRLLHGID